MEGLQVVHSSNLESEASDFQLNLHTVNCEKSYAMSTYTSIIENVEKTLQRDSSNCRVLIKDKNLDEQVGVHETLDLQNTHEQHIRCNWTTEEDKSSKASNTTVIGVRKELIHFDATMEKCLRKSATFPSSDIGSSLLLYTKKNGASTNTDAPILNLSEDHLPTYKRSTSLPASSKPVSAMKGGRAQKGTLPPMDMHVKWAVDVYDPPTTLMSHTVKNNQLKRPKSNKKDNRKTKKNNKCKNSRGNSSGKKLPNTGSVCNSPTPIPAKCVSPQSWLPAGGENGSAQSESGGKSAIEILELAIDGIQDVKCGKIFLRESLAKLHISFGEAT